MATSESSVVSPTATGVTELHVRLTNASGLDLPYVQDFHRRSLKGNELKAKIIAS
jgi:hypothetical protein